MLNEKISVHLPIGFRVDARYEKFWREGVANHADTDFCKLLGKWQVGKHPFVLLSMRIKEQKRSVWRGRTSQLASLLKYLADVYPDIGFILDGLTSYGDEAAAGIRVADESALLQCLSERFDILSLHGESLENKIYAYRIVDHCLGQFGSGTLLPAYAYGVSTTTICDDPKIISVYGDPMFITTLAKENSIEFAKFLPAECVLRVDDGFSLNEETAYPFILEHLRVSISSDASRAI